MKNYRNSSRAQALVFGLIVLLPASMTFAQGSGPDRDEQPGAAAGTGQRFRTLNRPNQGAREQAPRASRSAPDRGQQVDAQRNQAFRPNSDNQEQSRRMPPMSAKNVRSGQASGN